MKADRCMIGIILVAVMFLFTLAPGCIRSTGAKSFWTAGHNSFRTNDLKRAQQEIPFAIVLPKYLPGDFDPYHPNEIVGPVRGSYRDEPVEVEISYRREGRRDIFITQINRVFIEEPTPELYPKYLEISGIRILQQKTFMYSTSDTTEGLKFKWNQEGRTFTVAIYSFSEDDGVKIVSSMIGQMAQIRIVKKIQWPPVVLLSHFPTKVITDRLGS